MEALGSHATQPGVRRELLSCYYSNSEALGSHATQSEECDEGCYYTVGTLAVSCVGTLAVSCVGTLAVSCVSTLAVITIATRRL